MIDFDVGNMVAVAAAEEDGSARDVCQELMNRLLQLPRVRKDDGIFITLPAPTTRLPRHKALPAPKPMTKWEKFAKQKGISKNPKGPREGKLQFDEAKGEWVPKWGFGASRVEDDWLIEAKKGEEDPRADARAERKGRKRKQEERRKDNAQEGAIEAAKSKVDRVKKDVGKERVLKRVPHTIAKRMGSKEKKQRSRRK